MKNEKATAIELLNNSKLTDFEYRLLAVMAITAALNRSDSIPLYDGSEEEFEIIYKADCFFCHFAALDKKISEEAYRLLVKIYTLPDDFYFSIPAIGKELHWKEKKVKDALNCLLKQGYAEKQRVKDKYGHSKLTYKFYESSELNPNFKRNRGEAL